MDAEAVITSGSLLYYRLYDVAWEIDLEAAEARLKDSRRMSIESKLFGKAFEFKNPPVSVRLADGEAELGGRTRDLRAYAKLYDYGVISVIIDAPLDGLTLREMESLAVEVRDREPFEARARAELERLFHYLDGTMTNPRISEIEEDYTIYHLRALQGAPTSEGLLAACNTARLLMEEEGEPPPGRAVARDLLLNAYSYSDRDLVIINWDNALVLEPSGSMDIPDLLEFATGQLLELRVYDKMLDREMDSIYERVSRRGSPSIWNIKRYEKLAAKVMLTVTDLTEITEKVDNALKVTEDVYYGKVYTSALELFKVRKWEASIRRKLDLAARVYNMLYQEISTRRNELLELVIIILIAVDIVLLVLGV